MRPLKQAIYSSRTADKFVVRLPDGMRERIADVAKESHRSMNSEIIARLEASLNSGEVIDPPLPEFETPWNPVVGALVWGKRKNQPRTMLELGVIRSFTISTSGDLLIYIAWSDDASDCDYAEPGTVRPFLLEGK